jgi:hypothetical protein
MRSDGNRLARTLLVVALAVMLVGAVLVWVGSPDDAFPVLFGIAVLFAIGLVALLRLSRKL